MERIEKLLQKISTTDETLTFEEISYIENLLQQYCTQNDVTHKTICKIGIILDYNKLKQSGKTKEEITKYIDDDQKTALSAEEYLAKHLELKERMFGYPANMNADTSLVKYLRYLESQLFLINGCGGPNDRGNYQMDNKDMELQIIELFMKNLNINKDNYWGYITSGGTEGNFWGIKSGFDNFPNGTLYFSNEAHYSVDKFVNQNGLKIYDNQVISSEYGKINTLQLIEQCKRNWEINEKPAIILLTWGTTKTGAIDNVEYIEKSLTRLNIPHYIHLDAALFGGIPNNQNDAPVLTNFTDLNVDSVSISLHKYLGSSKVNGVVISKSKNKAQFIDYIGQEDSTILGSRDFLPFSIYQKIVDLFERTSADSYQENINYFINAALDNGLFLSREGNGNIFIIEKPSDELCLKYQLATYNSNGKSFAHIIIFPSHNKENILALVEEIAKEKNNINKPKEYIKSN